MRVDITAGRGGFDLAVGFDVLPGRTLALLGPNGAGKSTTVGAIAGIVDYAGTIDLDGPIDHLPTEKRRVGVVFQDYLLFPHLTVLENVAFGPRSTGVSRSAARTAAMSWLDRLGASSLARNYPRELSGGQAQRVALARALAVEPKALLLDEPLAALDVEVRDDVRAELAGYLSTFEGATVVVTHNLRDAVALATDAVVLERGRVTQAGTVADLVTAPATPWIARLVGA